MLVVVAAGLFVLIWSTGWIVAKYAVPVADPLTFLAIRFGTAFLVLAIWSALMRATWPRTWQGWLHALVTGIFIHAIYLAVVWWVIAQGLPAGISALIAATQPLITAALAPALLGERLWPVNVAGILVGFLGVMGVLAPKLQGAAFAGMGMLMLANFGGMVSVTLGTFYQKKFGASGDLRTQTTIQYLAAFLFVLPLAYRLEPMRFEPVTETWLALAWSVLVLSIGAIMLMLWMIRRGAVSKLASLIYLVPPVVALQAYAMFGETLMPVQILFMGVTALGVYLANRK